MSLFLVSLLSFFKVTTSTFGSSGSSDAISFFSLVIKSWPIVSNNSFIPLDDKAETHLYLPLIELAYSSASLFLTSSFSYKSLLFPTIYDKTLFKFTVCFTSLYNFCTDSKDALWVMSKTNIIASLFW